MIKIPFLDAPPLGTNLSVSNSIAKKCCGAWFTNESGGLVLNNTANPKGNGVISNFPWVGGVLRQPTGSGQSIALPATYKPLDGLDSFSIYIKTIWLDNNDGGIFYTDTHGGGNPILLWYDTGTNFHINALVTTSGGTTNTLLSNFEPVKGAPYATILTLDNGVLSLSINGVRDTGGGFPANISGTLDATPSQYHFGNDDGGGKPLGGEFYKAALFTPALTENEEIALSENYWQLSESVTLPIGGAAGDIEATVNASVAVEASNVLFQEYSAELAGNVGVISSNILTNIINANIGGVVTVEALTQIQSVNRALLNSVVNVESLNSVQQKYLAIVGGAVNVNALLNLSQGSSLNVNASVNVDALGSLQQTYEAVIGGNVDVDAAYNMFVSSINALSVGGLVNVESNNNINQKYDIITSAYVNVISSNSIQNINKANINALVTVSALNSIQRINQALVGGNISVTSRAELFYNMSAIVNGSISVEALLTMFTDSKVEAIIGGFVDVNAGLNMSSALIPVSELLSGGYVYVKSHLSESENIMATFGFNGSLIPTCKILNFDYTECSLPIVKIDETDMASGKIKLNIPDLTTVDLTIKVQEAHNVNGYWMTTSLNIYTENILWTSVAGDTVSYRFDPDQIADENKTKYYVVFIDVNNSDNAEDVQGHVEFVIEILNY